MRDSLANRCMYQQFTFVAQYAVVAPSYIIKLFCDMGVEASGILGDHFKLTQAHHFFPGTFCKCPL